MIRKFLSILLFLALVSGCASPVDMGPGFEKVSGHFAEAVRWKDFQGASRFLVADARDTFLAEFPRDKDLHMVDTRFERMSMDAETGFAEAVLVVEYYMLPSPTIKEWRWTQQWRRADADFPTGGLWQIQSPPPVFP